MVWGQRMQAADFTSQISIGYLWVEQRLAAMCPSEEPDNLGRT